MKRNLCRMALGVAVACVGGARAEVAWPADFAQQVSDRKAAATAASSVSAQTSAETYTTLTATDCLLAGLGLTLAPFESRTWTSESATCAELKTKPIRGLYLNFR